MLMIVLIWIGALAATAWLAYRYLGLAAAPEFFPTTCDRSHIRAAVPGAKSQCIGGHGGCQELEN